MSDIDELKARARDLGLCVQEYTYRKKHKVALTNSHDTRVFETFDGPYALGLRAYLDVAEHAARHAAKRVKASARVCENHTDSMLCIRGRWTTTTGGDCGICAKCNGIGICFEEAK